MHFLGVLLASSITWEKQEHQQEKCLLKIGFPAMFTTFGENIPGTMQVVDVKMYPSCSYQQEQDERSLPQPAVYIYSKSDTACMLQENTDLLPQILLSLTQH